MNGTWLAPHPTGPLNAQIRIPGSKSQTARALYLAAVARTPSTIRGALIARDTELFIHALRSLGARIDTNDEAGTPVISVHPMPLSGPGEYTPPIHGESPAASEFAPDNSHPRIDCGLAGTVMRFLPPVAALSSRTTYFDGDVEAQRRPLAPLLNVLNTLGAQITYMSEPGHLPFSITGPMSVPPSRIVEVDASASSQFLSALLLVAPLLDAPVTIQAPYPVVSFAHVAMTIHTMRAQGLTIEEVEYVSQNHSDDGYAWRVTPGRPRGGEITIEPDLSNAGPFLAAALVSAGTVTIPAWPRETTQAGDAWRHILHLMGADVSFTNEGLVVRGPGVGHINGIDIDLSDVGELTPTIAALAALANSPSHLRGIGHLRGHETDRLSAIATELTRLGGDVLEGADFLTIRPRPLHGGTVDTYHDHRMATFGAILGLAIDEIYVDNVQTTSKTLPQFTRMWTEMLTASGMKGHEQ